MPVSEQDHYKNHYRQRLIAALLGIIHGVGVTDAEGHPTLVPVLNSVRKTSIFGALNDAALHLDEAFGPQELEIADRACAMLGIPRAANRKNEVARAILEALLAKHTR